MHVDRVALMENPRLDASGSSLSVTSSSYVPHAVLVSPGGITPQGDSEVSPNISPGYSPNVDTADGVPFRAVRESTDLRPISIPVEFDGDMRIKAEAQTDCGALLNAINHDWYLANAGQLGDLDPPDFHFHLADGSHVLNKGSISLRMNVIHHDGSIETSTRFQVMPTKDDWTILLGRPWLRDNRARVDYGTEELTVKRADGSDATWKSSDEPVSYEGRGFEARAFRRIHNEEREAWEWSVQPEVADEFTTSDRAEKILKKVTIGDSLTLEETRRVANLVRAKHQAFALDLSEVEACPHTSHSLAVDPTKKLTRKPFGRPLTEPEVVAAKKQVEKLLAAGVIERCRPDEVLCCAPIVMAPKKGEPEEVEIEALLRLANRALADAGLPHDKADLDTEDLAKKERRGKVAAEPEYRMCHNFTQINKATDVAAFPPGDLEQKVLRHSGRKYISKIDALGAFYWVSLDIPSRNYLCFYVQGYGYLRYTRLPMGPTGSPGTYQVALERTLGDLLEPGPVSAWMDDLFTSSDEFESMFQTLELTLDRAIRDKLRFAPGKTFLFVESTTIGGSIVDCRGVSPDPAKVRDLLNWPKPKTARDVLSFVNTAAVFRNAIPKFAEVAAPLYSLTRDLQPEAGRRGAHKHALEAKGVEELWTDECNKAFVQLQTCLTTFPVVVGPIYDGRPFHIACDASAVGFGAHLYQERDGHASTIAYASRATTPAEAKRHSSELELRGAKWAMDKFGKYTYGQKVILHTDCQAVKDLLRSDTATGSRAGWKEAIAGSRIVDFVHRRGIENEVADGLSRIGSGAPTATDMGWEETKGIENSWMNCRMITRSWEDDLLRRFENDAFEDVVRWILQRNTDEIEESSREDVQRQACNFFIEGEKLKRRADGYGVVEVVPTTEGLPIAEQEHREKGHLGRDLMTTSLVQRYYWTTMRRDIDAAISSCPRCVQFGTRMQRLLLKPIIRFSPFDMVALDFLHMPKGRGGLDMLLVAIDCFSRYIMVWAFKGNPSADRVVKCLTDIENKFVTPRELLMDNFFDNKEVREWAEKKGVALTFSAPYAHVGLVENANHLVLERLRRLANTDIHHVPLLERAVVPTKWPTELDASVRALNERKMTILGGFSPKDLLFGSNIGKREGSDRVEPAVRMLMTEAIRMEASDAFVKEQARRLSKSKEWNAYAPAIGDLVLIYDASGDRSFDTGWKLRARWQGPYVVHDVRRRSAKVRTLDGRQKGGWVAWALMRRWRDLRKEAGGQEGEVENGGRGDDEESDGRNLRSGNRRQHDNRDATDEEAR